MFEAFKVAALALPVADLVLNVLKGSRLPKIRHRKDRLKNRLEPDVVAFLRNQIHLQEPVVRLALHLYQVWNLRCRVDLREVDSLRCLACPSSQAMRISLKRIVDHISKKPEENTC